MNARHLPSRLTAGAALLLGHASVLWGLGIAPVYFAGFVLLMTQPIDGVRLGYEWPLIGVALGASGLVLTQFADEMPSRSPAFGLVLNLIGLAFAVALRSLIG